MRQTKNEREVLRSFEERLRLESHKIGRAPELAFPQLFNHLVSRASSSPGAVPTGTVNLLDHQATIQRVNWLCLIQGPLLGQPSTDDRLSGYGPVVALTVTPDGSKVVSGSADHTIRIWNLASGKLLRTLDDHTDSVTAIVVTPDSLRVVSGSSDRALKVWDLESGRLLCSSHTDSPTAVWGGREKWAMLIALTGDGSKVISGCRDGTLKVWNVASGKLLRTLEDEPSDLVTSIAVTRNGKTVISGSRDDHYVGTSRSNHTLKVWDLDSGRILRLAEDQTTFRAVALTPDDSKVVAGSSDGTLRIWSLDSGSLLRSVKTGASINEVVVTPDGSKIVTGSADATFKIWDLASGQMLRALDDHSGWVTGLAVTPDGSRLVSGTSDGAFRTWDSSSGDALPSLGDHIEKADEIVGVKLTADASRVVSWSSDAVSTWDLASGRPLGATQCPFSLAAGTKVTPDGSKVVSGTTLGAVKVFDVVAGRALFSLEGYEYWHDTFALTRDGTKVVQSASNLIKVWDLVSGELLHSLKGGTDRISTIVVTPDGSKLVSGSDDGAVELWDIATGRLLRSLEGGSRAVDSLVLTPDCSKVVASSFQEYPRGGSTFRVWNLNSGRLLRTVEHEHRTLAVMATPDGAKLISRPRHVNTNGTNVWFDPLKVWDLASGHLVRSLEGQARPDSVLGVTPDSSKVLLYSHDQTFKSWDLNTGDLRALFRDDTITCMSLSHDCHHLVCGDKHGRLWIFEWIT